MEALLSLSFDNTSSKDIIKIRKGLRQIEGLLAQICIPPSCSQQKRRPSSSSSRLSGDTLLPPRQLSQVCQDPAYREFFRLQEGFEWNGTYSWPCFDFDRLTCTKVASRLMACLETLLGMPNGSYSRPTMNLLHLTCYSYPVKRHHPLGSGYPPRSAPPPPSLARSLPPRELHGPHSRPSRRCKSTRRPVASPPRPRYRSSCYSRKHSHL